LLKVFKNRTDLSGKGTNWQQCSGVRPSLGSFYITFLNQNITFFREQYIAIILYEGVVWTSNRDFGNSLHFSLRKKAKSSSIT